MKTIRVAAIGFKEGSLKKGFDEETQARQRLLRTATEIDLELHYFPTIECFRAIETEGSLYHAVLCAEILRLNPESSQKDNCKRVINYCEKYSIPFRIVRQNRTATYNNAPVMWINQDQAFAYNWNRPQDTLGLLYFWLITKSNAKIEKRKALEKINRPLRSFIELSQPESN